MARINRPFGKDDPERFIDNALTGGDGTSVREGVTDSNGMHSYPVDRKDQSILTAVAMDNVKHALDVPTSILDTKFAGGIENLEHSLTGASAVQSKVGDASNARSTVIPNH